MRRGVWLTAVARRIIRKETFESLVAPALADLQYEAASDRPVGRHYAALVIVMATALLRDLRVDVQLTFGASRVWRRAGAWYSGFVVFYAVLVMYADTPWHLLDTPGQASALAYALAIGLVTSLPYALVATVFYLRRESVAPRRTIAVAAMVFIAAAFAFEFTSASVLRRWTVFFRILGLIVTYAVVQIATIRLQIPVLTGGHDAVRQMFAMFLTAVAWLLGVRLLLLPLLPVYALTKARRLVPRRSSRLP